MKSFSKRICGIVLTFALLFSMQVYRVSASPSDAMNWYCVGNKEHKTPVKDSCFSFIEKYDAVYADLSPDRGKTVYLTFDAGYENGNVEKILDTLKEHNVKGAFFILEHLVKDYPDLVLRMVNEGHLVCNHSKNHPDMTKLSEEQFEKQLRDLEKSFFELTGREIDKIYRPPEGRFSENTLGYAKKLGYKTAFWSFAYADWDNNKQPDPEKALEKVLLHIHPGEIMLLHPTSATNAKILPEIIKRLEEMGYSFGCLYDIYR